MKVRFTKVFSTKQPGDVKEYDDQYATWLIEIMQVAVQYMEPMPKKDIKTIPVTKEEKHVVKRTTKNAKG